MQLAETRRPPEGKHLPRAGRSRLRRFVVLLAAVFCATGFCCAQPPSWSARVADALIARSPGAEAGGSADLKLGLELEGLDAAWYNTANGEYFRYIRRVVDANLEAHPTAASANPENDALMARQILHLYRVTLAPKYFTAAEAMQRALLSACPEPGTHPPPVSLAEDRGEALCPSQPFLSEYAAVFERPQDFASITQSLKDWNARIGSAAGNESRALGPNGLRLQMAWLAFALAQSLPYYPPQDPGRGELVEIFRRLADRATRSEGRAGFEGLEATNGLLVFALEKGIRLGYLPQRFSQPAEEAWRGLVKQSVRVDGDGAVHLNQAESKQPGQPAGHGSDSADALTGGGALLLAATEADHVSTATMARGQTVLLDAWYNSQRRKNPAGQLESFHYKWSDFSDSGYSLLGHLFRSYGAVPETLDSAPTQAKLSEAGFYIIASPDIPIKNPEPHYMTGQDAAVIAAWVSRGGVLVMMENDPPNADLTHLNLLADRFKIHFDDVLHHHILGEQVDNGRIVVAPDGVLFRHPHTLYMKDTCAISLQAPAIALLRDRGDVVMATVKFGRGTVFAAVDPWLYNEYTDGRKNPLIYNQFDNFAGGEEFVQWLLQQRPR
jgi:unsaturated rhamnogalacturonyl hydrolase